MRSAIRFAVTVIVLIGVGVAVFHLIRTIGVHMNAARAAAIKADGHYYSIVMMRTAYKHPLGRKPIMFVVDVITKWSTEEACTQEAARAKTASSVRSAECIQGDGRFDRYFVASRVTGEWYAVRIRQTPVGPEGTGQEIPLSNQFVAQATFVRFGHLAVGKPQKAAYLGGIARRYRSQGQKAGIQETVHVFSADGEVLLDPPESPK